MCLGNGFFSDCGGLSEIDSQSLRAVWGKFVKLESVSLEEMEHKIHF